MVDSKEICDIVRKASALMMDRSFAIEQKDGCANIVTSSDLAVQEFLCRELSAALPGCGFICEEEGVCDPDKEYVWIIDPIDGTANYARGLDHCCISVGLKHLDEIVLGVVFCPSRDEMYCAEKGKGACCNGSPIHASSRTFEDGIMFAALSTYHKEYSAICSDIILDVYRRSNDTRRYGSAAIELCMMAAGYAELYFEMLLQPWDYAAAMLILSEAGGVVSSLDGGQPRFSGPDMIIAANSPANHSRLLSIVRSHLDKVPYFD